MSGYVYLISGGASLRLTSLRTGSPLPLTLVCDLAARNPQTVEKRLHEHFADKQITETGREWFRLKPDDIGWIENAAKWQRHDDGDCAKRIAALERDLACAHSATMFSRVTVEALRDKRTKSNNGARRGPKPKRKAAKKK